jgi:hypothetical protein
MLLAMALVGVVLLLAVFGLVVYFTMFSQRRMQNQADRVTLVGAGILNRGDRTGQMNNMVARSRELVYNAREIHQRARSGYSHLEPLARQLLEESRAGAHLVEEERQRMVQLNLQQAMEEVKNAASQGGSSRGMSFFGVKTSTPELVGMEVGYIDGVLSSVDASEGNPELKALDVASGYVDKETGLYKANVNARLPSPDSDLNFKICSLPAPVKKEALPARLIQPSVFRRTARLMEDGKEIRDTCEHLPSAVRLVFETKVTSGQDSKQPLQVSTVAITSGALPPP